MAVAALALVRTARRFVRAVARAETAVPAKAARFASPEVPDRNAVREPAARVTAGRPAQGAADWALEAEGTRRAAPAQAGTAVSAAIFSRQSSELRDPLAALCGRDLEAVWVELFGFSFSSFALRAVLHTHSIATHLTVTGRARFEKWCELFSLS